MKRILYLIIIPFSIALLVGVNFSLLISASEGKPIILSPEALRDPEITIELEETVLYANVEPGEDGVVSANGVVHCDMPPGSPPSQFCVVTLQADAGGWAVSGAPSLTFDRSTSEQSFSISVQVPVETSHSAKHLLTVSGKWRYSPGTGGGNVEPVFCPIEIIPYGAIKIAPDPMNSSIPIGTWRNVEILIKNEGNHNDLCTISIEHSSEGVEAYLEESEINIGEKKEKTVILRVRQRSGATGPKGVSIRVLSLHQGKKANATGSIRFTTSMSVKGIISNPFLMIGSVLILIIVGIVIFLVTWRLKENGHLDGILSRIRSRKRNADPTLR